MKGCSKKNEKKKRPCVGIHIFVAAVDFMPKLQQNEDRPMKPHYQALISTHNRKTFEFKHKNLETKMQTFGKNFSTFSFFIRSIHMVMNLKQ